MKQELKACPNCGDIPTAIFNAQDSWLYIECCVSMSIQKCDYVEDAMGDGKRWYEHCDENGIYSKEAEEELRKLIVKMWNTRPREAELEKENSELKSGVNKLIKYYSDDLEKNADSYDHFESMTIRMFINRLGEILTDKEEK